MQSPALNTVADKSCDERDSKKHSYNHRNDYIHDNKKRFLVQVPGYADPFELPLTLAAALVAIAQSGDYGVSTEELESVGFSNDHNNIYRLRKRGVPIMTTWFPEDDINLDIYRRFSYYSVVPEEVTNPKNWTPDCHVKLTRIV